MMIEPPIDKLIDKVGCKYALVIMTAKRARQHLNRYNENAENDRENPVSKAAREIYDGTIIPKGE